MVAISRFPLVFLVFHLLTITINGQQNPGNGNVFNILQLGAQRNGDATQALTKAWKQACESPTPSKILIPAGNYNLRAVALLGPCKSRIAMEVLGNLKAPADPAAFKGNDTWVKFEHVDGLVLTAPKGSGVFDGQGQIAWRGNSCNKTWDCHNFPYNFRFNFVNNSEVSGITSLNSKLFHMALLGCKQMNLHDVIVTAPGDSPNTDGIHIGRSEGINITRFIIGTGDDCVSFGDGAKDVLVEGVVCGPGHGISIGSLGKYPNEDPVTGITIRNCTVKNTLTGVRVKTWYNSYEAHASALHFENIVIQNVTQPLIVDQEYCPWNQCKSKSPSKVKISDMKFVNIRGTSNTKEAVKVFCSAGVPCEKVELTDIDLTYSGPGGPAVSQCKNVMPKVLGKQNPPSCASPVTPMVEP